MSNTNAVKQFFNKLAPVWDEGAEFASVREEIICRAAFPTGCTIADVGCGQGVLVPHLLQTNPLQLFELDLSEEMIRFNRKRWGDHNRITILCGDILDADLPPLDAIAIFNAYPHLLDKAALAKRLAGLLCDHGVIVIAHSSGRDTINNIHRDSGPCETISIPLKSPLEEYEPYKEGFHLDDWEDSPRLYYMKLTKKHTVN